MKLILIRHGPTAWNREKRIQGHNDQPLSREGIEWVRSRIIADQYKQLPWYCSPLQRARETARLMGIPNPIIEPALIEMNWGDWEGEVLKPLRKRLGDTMRLNEARGLDFCPPNGESPRQVQARLKAWLAGPVNKKQNCAAVVHQGIIRCMISMVTDWDMRGEIPFQLDWYLGFVFNINESGNPDHGFTCSDLTVSSADL